MRNADTVILVSTLWLVLVPKVAQLLCRSRARLLLLGAFATLALAMTSVRPQVYDALTAITGVPNFAYWLAYGPLAIIGAWCGSTLLLEIWDRPLAARLARRRGLGYLAALACLTLFFLAGPVNESHTVLLAHLPSDSVARAGFRLVNGVTLTLALWRIGSVAARMVRSTEIPALRFGMGAVVVGSILSGIRMVVEQCGLTVWFLATSSTTPGPTNRLVVALNFTALLGAAMLSVGPSLTSVWTTLGRLRREFAAYRLLRRTQVLASALAPAAPTVRPVSRWRDRVTPSRRLYRRVIELNDRILVLRPYYADPPPPEAFVPGPRTLPEQHVVPLTEAVRLRAALERKLAGLPQTQTELDDVTGEDDVLSEARRLAEVSSCWPAVVSPA